MEAGTNTVLSSPLHPHPAAEAPTQGPRQNLKFTGADAADMGKKGSA